MEFDFYLLENWNSRELIQNCIRKKTFNINEYVAEAPTGEKGENFTYNYFEKGNVIFDAIFGIG